MTHQHKVAILCLKQILLFIAIIFAIAATLLIILLTSAATATGSTPLSAISLIDGVNSGILGSGEQRWFRIVPNMQSQAVQTEKSLTLTFTFPDDALNQYVSLQLFKEDQIQLFTPNDTSQMTSFGVGQVIVNDNNSETGKLFWTGSILNERTYYVLIGNSSDLSVDYSLFAEDVNIDAQTDERAIETSGSEAVPLLGTNPDNAISLMPDVNRGRIKPQTTSWYTFAYNDFSDGNQFQDLSFSIFFTPDDGIRRHRVNFEIFTANEVEAWLHGDQNGLTNFGAGMLVSRDGDFNTGERIWKGTVLKGDTYFLAIQNGTEVEIDYWLFDNDIYNPELGPKLVPASPPVFAQGAAPQAAIPLTFGRNIGGLEPGQEVWYSFSVHDNDDEFFEEMALTMIATPDDGNRIHNINFDVFTADGVRNWSPGDNSKINNVGAGSITVRDNNPQTGERFWTGWVAEDELYYVQIRNGTEVHVDYWLFTDDVYGPELGRNVTDN